MAATELQAQLTKVETRVNRLEAEIARINQEREAETAKQPWWEKIRGSFKDDPAYIEAMQLGREWRQSQQADDEEPAN